MKIKMTKPERVVYNETKKEINFSTGEIKTEEITNVVKIPKEPPYVKMYIDDLAKILELTSGCRSLLYFLIKKMDYEGIITLTKSSRDRLAEQIGVKETAVRNQITQLCQKGILRRIGTGEFEANPNLFARGDWSDIHKRRKCFKLTINYENEKRTLNGSAINDI
jgi:Firmicute plasmid replication protein (RepL).